MRHLLQALQLAGSPPTRQPAAHPLGLLSSSRKPQQGPRRVDPRGPEGGSGFLSPLQALRTLTSSALFPTPPGTNREAAHGLCSHPTIYSVDVVGVSAGARLWAPHSPVLGNLHGIPRGPMGSKEELLELLVLPLACFEIMSILFHSTDLY